MKINAVNLIDILGISKGLCLTGSRAEIISFKNDRSGNKYFNSDDLAVVPEVSEMLNLR